MKKTIKFINLPFIYKFFKNCRIEMQYVIFVEIIVMYNVRDKDLKN